MPGETFETPQPTEPTVEPKATSWPKIILAGALGLGLLGAAYAGYWYGTQEISNLKNQISRPQPKTQNQATPTPTPTSVVEDETQGWKTYTNENYMYELKYPERWVLKPDKQVPDQIVNFLRNTDQEDHCGLGIYGEGSSTSLPEGVEPIEVELIVVGGATPSREIYSDPFGLETVFWWIKFPEKRYKGGGAINQITAQYNIGDTSCLKFLDQILSTFKFLD